MGERGGVVDIQPVEVAAVDDLRPALRSEDADALGQRRAVERRQRGEKACDTAKMPVS